MQSEVKEFTVLAEKNKVLFRGIIYTSEKQLDTFPFPLDI